MKFVNSLMKDHYSFKNVRPGERFLGGAHHWMSDFCNPIGAYLGEYPKTTFGKHIVLYSVLLILNCILSLEEE
jgi:hypothetical protein